MESDRTCHDNDPNLCVEDTSDARLWNISYKKASGRIDSYKPKL